MNKSIFGISSTAILIDSNKTNIMKYFKAIQRLRNKEILTFTNIKILKHNLIVRLNSWFYDTNQMNAEFNKHRLSIIIQKFHPFKNLENDISYTSMIDNIKLQQVMKCKPDVKISVSQFELFNMYLALLLYQYKLLK